MSDKELKTAQVMALIDDSSWESLIIMSREFKELEEFLLEKYDDFDSFLITQNYFSQLDEEDNQELSNYVRWYSKFKGLKISETILELEDFGLFEKMFGE